MELRQLRYFVAVAETRHFSRAAERLHMAQSPLSQAIRQLEAQIGATLFERTTRRVDLTPAGEAFYRDALRILDSVETSKLRVGRVAAGDAGVLTVAATGLAAYRVLPRLGRLAAREMPGVSLRFVPGLLTTAQEDALVEGRIDVGVLRPPVVRPELSVRSLVRERFVAVLPEDHRLAGRDRLRLADLADDPFVLYGTPGSVVDAIVAKACLDAGFLPRRAEESPDTPVLLTHVASGAGVAVLPESVTALGADGVRYVPVADDAEVEVALAWRTADPSPALAQLLDTVAADPGFADPGGTP